MDGPKPSTTQHQIENITYIVAAAPSEGARVRLDEKILKLLQRDLQQGRQFS